MGRVRALRRAAIAYGLWIALLYLQGFLPSTVFGVKPSTLTVYWLPPLVNLFVIWGLPGIIAAVVAYFWRGRLVDKAAISAVYILGFTLWIGILSVAVQPMPVSLIEEDAAKYGFTKCGEYYAAPGRNVFTLNMTLDAPTNCYYLVLRPEPRNAYAIRFTGSEVVSVKVLPESKTNVYRSSTWLQKFSFSMFHYNAHYAPQFLTIGIGRTIGDYEKRFNSTNTPQPFALDLAPDDYVLWFKFSPDYSDLGRGMYVRVQLYTSVEFYVERILP